MLVLPKAEVDRKNKELKDGLIKVFNDEMDLILRRNTKKERYWILGKVNFPKELQGKVAKMFLKPFDEMPSNLVNNSFVYYVDNKRGVKHFMWKVENGNVTFAEFLQ